MQKVKILSKKIGYWTSVIIIGAIIGFASQFAKAWTEPTTVAPNENVGAPINTSATAQLKAGALGISGVLHGYSSAIFDGNVGVGRTAAYKLDVNGITNSTQYCINGANCISAWPSGGTNYWTLSSTNIYNNNSGNVGVGATGPISKLSVGGNGISGAAVYGTSTAYGAYGTASNSNGVGVYGTNTYSGTASYGVVGMGGAYGVGGNGTVAGTRGISSSGYGIYGTSTSSYGVYGVGTAASGGYGVVGEGAAGVVGTGTSTGVHGYASSSSGHGVEGYADGSGGSGVYANGATNGYGVYVTNVTSNGTGIYSQGNTYGGYFLGTNVSSGIGVYASGISYDFKGAGGEYAKNGQWSPASDINLKENITNLDSQEILNKIANLSVPEWNYKTDKNKTKHIGPMAQDMYSIFGVGDDPTHYAYTDPIGISLIGVKALNEKVDAQQKEIDDLKAQIEEIKNK